MNEILLSLKDVCECRRGTKDINLVTVSKKFFFQRKVSSHFIVACVAGGSGCARETFRGEAASENPQVLLSVHGDPSFLFHFWSINTIFHNGQSLKKPLRWVPYFGGMNLIKIQTDHVSDIL